MSYGKPYRDGRRVLFFENGQKKSVLITVKDGKKGKIKEFNSDGKCIKRIKVRNNKIRGGYCILDGRMKLSAIVRWHQLHGKVYSSYFHIDG